MKIFRLVFAFAIVLSLNCIIIAKSYSETWEKTYQGSGYDRGGFVQQTSDGGYIVIGNSQDSSYQDDIYLIKTDASGNKVWGKSFGGQASDNVQIGSHAVQQTSDGGYILVGETQSFGAGSDDIYLVKTDASGNGLWSKTFGGSGPDSGKSVQQTADGGYIIVGSTGPYETQKAYLIKTDGSGNQVWSKTYGGSDRTYGGGVRQTSDGGYIVVGRIETSTASGIYILKTDASGNPFWSKIVGGADGVGHSVLPTSDGGYIIFGAPWEEAPTLTKTDSNGNQIWHKTYSGLWQEATWGEQTDDGGYIFAASTETNPWNVALIKTDANGSEQWRKTFPGKGGDSEGKAVRVTNDGGYIVVGYTGDYPDTEFYLIKTDSDGNINGDDGDNNVFWSKTFGGSGMDQGYSVLQTTDGGYIIVGETAAALYNPSDVYLIKTGADGTKLWEKTFGGSGWDAGWSVQQTTDGGYIIGGDTESSGTGDGDAYLIKTDTYGNLQWEKTFGANNWHSTYSVQQMSDGGYVIVGETAASSFGVSDVFLIKTDAYGNLQWEKTFGGSSYDWGQSVQQTSDGGYIIVGRTASFGAGGYDVYLIKTGVDGNKLWEKTFGGSGDDAGTSIEKTSDGGYIIVGYTSSIGAGGDDVYLLKADADGNKLWEKAFGSSGTDWGASVEQTRDGGFIIAGSTETEVGTEIDDVYLIKTGTDGTLQWEKTFGGSDEDTAYSVKQTSDGAYIVAGRTNSLGAGSYDVYLIYYLIDSDDDGLSDDIENAGCTDANDDDSDDDGIKDGIEDANHNGTFDSAETNPCNRDTDSDGLDDGVEDANQNGIADSGETNPRNRDTDGDGMPDGWETQYSLNPLVIDASGDADGDGYTNIEEYRGGSDPSDKNSLPKPISMPWIPLLLLDE